MLKVIHCLRPLTKLLLGKVIIYSGMIPVLNWHPQKILGIFPSKVANLGMTSSYLGLNFKKRIVLFQYYIVVL